MDILIWVDPSECDPPHRLTHEDRYWMLRESLSADGWKIEHPTLLGYRIMDRIQLISGTHRHAAAKDEQMKLPVALKPMSEIERIWGTDEWLEWVKNPPRISEVSVD